LKRHLRDVRPSYELKNSVHQNYMFIEQSLFVCCTFLTSYHDSKCDSLPISGCVVMHSDFSQSMLTSSLIPEQIRLQLMHKPCIPKLFVYYNFNIFTEICLLYISFVRRWSGLAYWSSTCSDENPLGRCHAFGAKHMYSRAILQLSHRMPPTKPSRSCLASK